MDYDDDSGNCLSFESLRFFICCSENPTSLMSLPISPSSTGDKLVVVAGLDDLLLEGFEGDVGEPLETERVM